MERITRMNLLFSFIPDEAGIHVLCLGDAMTHKGRFSYYTYIRQRTERSVYPRKMHGVSGSEFLVDGNLDE
ncbi:MAG: hypothetical protein C4532_00835 [Candidatus Abyssobacteria bacterium SURF_17]|uniref:Uncharacterized protein n=1 Tax=Candidatus Abyssobacteria bacterium SURF_17 TaxID=2093361 RepID=A0A419F943_9BACT|nr:MAG: hypothetical protein C4532_00835 [Candidatus Abyssubacteria bacterium SURF_17]